MKRRYKLLLIILLGCLITIIIYFSATSTNKNIVALGDGLSLGMTPYHVAGLSFNDYLRDYLENRHDLASFNQEFCAEHLTIDKLNTYLEKNVLSKSNKPIKQIIDQADIVTLAIGLDELALISLQTNDLDEYIANFILTYKNVLNEIRTFYQKDLIIIGLYPAYNLDKNTVITINQKLQELAVTFNTDFLDILAISLNKDYYLQPTSYYFNYQAHKLISQKIIKMLN